MYVVHIPKLHESVDTESARLVGTLLISCEASGVIALQWECLRESNTDKREQLENSFRRQCCVGPMWMRIMRHQQRAKVKRNGQIKPRLWQVELNDTKRHWVVTNTPSSQPHKALNKPVAIIVTN